MFEREMTPRLSARVLGVPAQGKVLPEHAARRVVRDVNEAARDVARDLAKTEAFAHSRRDRKKIGMLFAHLKRISGSIDYVYGAREVRSSSSHWQRSHRT
jgi:hypothetical protein